MFKSKGFTIIELVIIIVVLGILAVAVLYKIGSFKSEAGGITAVDQVIADIQYTQMLAMSGRAEKHHLYKRFKYLQCGRRDKEYARRCYSRKYHNIYI